MLVALVTVLVAAGTVIGGLVAWLILRKQVRTQRRSEEELSTSFKALSAETLQRTTSSFLDLAKDKIESVATAQLSPIKESLQRFDEKVEALERARQHERGALMEQIVALQRGAEQLRGETAGLVTALRASEVRGQWGELQLRRTLELAGMLEHCDFEIEVPVTGDEGLRRPDAIVRLPGGKNIVVDAKVPGFEALLEGLQTDDDAIRNQRLDAFVRHVRDRMQKLSEKAYWRQFAPSPEYVILFLPSESFYRYAIERDGSLLEHGPQQKVIFASPTTLIALLMTAAAAWREETLAESAREISEQGQLLYERLATMGGHFGNLGRRLSKAVEAFNDTLGSLETRVLPAARRFPELGLSSKHELAPVEPIDLAVRSATAAELSEPSAPGRTADAA
jgi:DNA recombination protein RmuC